MVDDNDGDSIKTGTTGIDKLDALLLSNGIEYGTSITIQSSPLSPNRELIGTMISDSSAYYYTTFDSKENIEDTLSGIPKVNLENVHIEDVSGENKIETLLTSIEKNDFPTNSRIIIDSTNVLERYSYDDYRRLLHKLGEVTRDKKCICILHRVEDNESVDNSWMTLNVSESIFELEHEEDRQTVSNNLVVQKLNIKQKLTSGDTRKYELTEDVKIDIKSTRNVST